MYDTLIPRLNRKEAASLKCADEIACALYEYCFGKQGGGKEEHWENLLRGLISCQQSNKLQTFSAVSFELYLNGRKKMQVLNEGNNAVWSDYMATRENSEHHWWWEPSPVEISLSSFAQAIKINSQPANLHNLWRTTASADLRTKRSAGWHGETDRRWEGMRSNLRKLARATNQFPKEARKHRARGQSGWGLIADKTILVNTLERYTAGLRERTLRLARPWTLHATVSRYKARVNPRLTGTGLWLDLGHDSFQHYYSTSYST